MKPLREYLESIKRETFRSCSEVKVSPMGRSPPTPGPSRRRLVWPVTTSVSVIARADPDDIDTLHSSFFLPRAELHSKKYNPWGWVGRGGEQAADDKDNYYECLV